MELIDLHAQQERIRGRIESRIRAVLKHGQYVMGPEVKELEARLADYVGVKHAIGCASGTDGLLMALMALKVSPGDAVFTTPFTFIATAEVISLLGATPVFVDIDEQTFNLDPEKLRQAIIALERNDRSLYPLPLTSHPSPLTPKGIIPVDLFGLPADYDAIQPVARQHGLWVVEDAAQSFGAEYRGKKAGCFGNISSTSFYPAKPLGCYGDGGMCFTNDDSVAEIMDSIREHGKATHKNDNVRIGINGRLDTLQAAILMAKFEIFPEEVELRQQIARRYSDLLASKSSLLTPRVPSGLRSVWAQYSVVAPSKERRISLQDKLKAEGIPTAVYYPETLHRQPAFAYLGYKEGDFPVAEGCASRIFSLPMHPYLSPADQEKIARLLKL
jgi:UDP-2-acetamido-2-deoxy-ribo-hexuluronate aminotransferase